MIEIIISFLRISFISLLFEGKLKEPRTVTNSFVAMGGEVAS